MGKFALILNLVGKVFPMLMKDEEFKPWRLFAVVVLMITIGLFVHFIGAENTGIVLEHTGDAMKLTTE